MNFSQGQLQRLAIARALLRNSPVMLMDETTSALDSNTEKRVLENIMEQNGELLTELCVVAHESLGGRVAVVNPDAALGQQSAYVALAAAYASGDGCAYHCCSMR